MLNLQNNLREHCATHIIVAWIGNLNLDWIITAGFVSVVTYTSIITESERTVKKLAGVHQMMQP